MDIGGLDMEGQYPVHTSSESVGGDYSSFAGYEVEGYQSSDARLNALGNDELMSLGEDTLHHFISNGTLDLPDVIFGTLIQSSTSSQNTSFSMKNGLESQSDEPSPSNDIPSNSASDNTDLARQYLCKFKGCGKSFTHPYKLK